MNHLSGTDPTLRIRSPKPPDTKVSLQIQDLVDGEPSKLAGEPAQTEESVVKLATAKSVNQLEYPLFHGSADVGQRISPIVCNKTLISDPFTAAENVSYPAVALVQDVGLTMPIMPTAKPEARQLIALTREQRRVVKDRYTNFNEAALFAYEMGWPINVALTITWAALVQAGSRNEGHCLAMGEAEKDTYLRNELARCRLRIPGVPNFVAIWGRDVGSRMGLHVHMGLFWPHRDMAKLVNVLERVTGSEMGPDPRKKPIGYYAGSACGGWQLKNVLNGLPGALGWINYIAAQDQKHPTRVKIEGKSFGVSQSIGPAARRKGAPH